LCGSGKPHLYKIRQNRSVQITSKSWSTCRKKWK